MSDFRSEARRWLAAEPDEDMREELEGLLAGPDDELSVRFDGRLQFGTAGLRAAVGAGPQRMNRAHAFLVDHTHIDRALSSHLEEPRMRTGVVQSVLRRQRDVIAGRAGRRLLLMAVQLAAHMSHRLQYGEVG